MRATKQGDKARRLETLAVLGLACGVIGLVGYRRHGLSWAENGWLIAAIAFLAIGCFVPPLANLITRAWFGLSHILGAVVSRLILCGVFFAILVPLALIRRLFEKDPLRLKRGGASYFINVDKRFGPPDLKHPW